MLSIIKRRGSLGLLAHGDSEERFTRTRSEIESGIAIALGGLVAEEMLLGESGTGPASDLAAATVARRPDGRRVRHGGLADLLRGRRGRPDRRTNLVAKVLSDAQGKARVEDILTQQKQLRRGAARRERRRPRARSRDALIERDELVGDEILEVIEHALSLARRERPLAGTTLVPSPGVPVVHCFA